MADQFKIESINLRTYGIAAIVLPLFYISYKIFSTTGVRFDRYELHSKDGNQSKWNSLDDVMRTNYRKNRDYIYQVEQPHKDIVVIPAKYVDELKNLPNSKVNFLDPRS